MDEEKKTCETCGAELVEGEAHTHDEGTASAEESTDAAPEAPAEEASTGGEASEGSSE